MKNIKLPLICILALFCTPLIILAQEETKERVKVRIETYDSNGKKKVVEREIDTKGMSEEEKDAIIEDIQKEAMKDISSSKRMKIVIREDQENSDIDDEDRFSFGDGDNSDVRVYRHKKGRKGSDMDFDFDFDTDEFNSEHFSEQMRVLAEDLPRKIQRAIPKIYTWNDGIFITDANASIQSLDVFPNRPATNEVNVRFYAPKEGDVTITILDTKGTVVGKESFEAFKGDFAGQVSLDVAPVGTYFVIVSQGDDGISRKVVFE
ncbi:Por secretion system C-terminal sorting domain-containing protein [Spirosomataceae bacterium TFI 002]|nr:Por secretion system C-terminal sorting domain-containing protein [Spirosomataceae bacterium TFI 002]